MSDSPAAVAPKPSSPQPRSAKTASSKSLNKPKTPNTDERSKPEPNAKLSPSKKIANLAAKGKGKGKGKEAEKVDLMVAKEAEIAGLKSTIESKDEGINQLKKEIEEEKVARNKAELEQVRLNRNGANTLEGTADHWNLDLKTKLQEHIQGLEAEIEELKKIIERMEYEETKREEQHAAEVQVCLLLSPHPLLSSL